MPANCALYISARDLPSELLRLDPTAKLQIDGSEAGWSEARVDLSNVRLEISHMTDAAELDEHLNGFCGYVMHCKGGKMDQPTFSLIQQILRTRHVLGMTIEPSFNERAIDFIRQLRARTNALLFLNSSVLDLEERLLVGPKGSDPNAELPRFESALERKAKSEKAAAELGIRVLPSLPPIAADEEVVMRSPSEIARRALCLWAVAVRGEGLEQEEARAIIDQAQLWDWVTPKEKAFLDQEDPTPHERTQFAWQYECLWVLGWALGVFDDLPPPTQICDVSRLAQAMVDASVESLLAANRPRSPEEILDQTDFIYRAHWAVTDDRVNGRQRASGGLQPGVVLERHRALNWLISYQNQDWDDVSTDT